MKEVIKDHLGNIYKTKKERAEAYGISNERVDARLKAGYTLEEALTTPLKDYSCVDHLGNKFASIGAMCKYYNINEGTYKDRIYNGWSIKDALTTENAYFTTDHLSNKFNTLTECAEYWNIPIKTLSFRLNNGWDIKKALTTPVRQKQITDHLGNVFSNSKKMCNFWNISYELYRSRVKDGWSIEDALTLDKIYSTRFDNDTFLNKLNTKYGDLYKPLEEYKGMNTNIDMLCTKCNKSWSVKPANIFTGYGCPHCKASNIEIEVDNYISSIKCAYEKEFTNHNCYSSGNGKSRFDFSINNIGLIEVDGEQHFFPVSNWDFEKCQKDDSIKTKYCENNNIPLLRIKYTQVQSGEYKSMIDDFIANPKKYIYNHNTYLSTKEYYEQTYAS